MKTSLRIMVTMAALCLAGTASRAGLSSPLDIGTTNSVVNQFGQVAPGSDATAALFNLPVVSGYLVEIIETYDRTNDAPGVNGLPVTTNNAVIATTHIGAGVDPTTGQTGQFGFSLPNYDGGEIFCRVFNASTIAGASFYGDSQLFTAGSGYTVFTPSIATVRPLDPSVTDPGGLNNSWLKLIGPIPTNFPSSNGAAAFAAFINSATPGNLASFVQMADMTPGSAGGMNVFCFTLTGETYQVEYTTNLLSGTFTPVATPVLATNWVTQVTQTGGTGLTNVFYRAKLLNP